jgi:predicted enzyme related to lactoylglutathione lyase
LSELTSIAAVLPVPEVGETARWYRDHFGFTVDPFPAAEPWSFAILERDSIRIMLQRRDKSRADGRAWSAYVTVKGLQELYETVRSRVSIIRAPHRQPYGSTEMEVLDPNEYVIVFSEVI